MSNKLTIADCETMIALAQGKKEELLLAQEEPEKRERLEAFANEYDDGVARVASFHDTKLLAVGKRLYGCLRTVRLVEPPTRKEWVEVFMTRTALGTSHVSRQVDLIAEMGCVTEVDDE